VWQKQRRWRPPPGPRETPAPDDDYRAYHHAKFASSISALITAAAMHKAGSRVLFCRRGMPGAGTIHTVRICMLLCGCGRGRAGSLRNATVTLLRAARCMHALLHWSLLWPAGAGPAGRTFHQLRPLLALEIMMMRLRTLVLIY
jgi:hypothetical protein